MVLELCLAWVCVHPLVVAQQAEEGGNVCLAACGAGCLLGGVSPVGSPGHNRMPHSQGKGSCCGVLNGLGLGQSAPGVCVPATLEEERVKNHFLSS